MSGENLTTCLSVNDVMSPSEGRQGRERERAKRGLYLDLPPLYMLAKAGAVISSGRRQLALG